MSSPPSPRDLVPPLADPALFDPRSAARALIGLQRAGLALWLDSCRQAQDLGLSALSWSEGVIARPRAAGEGR